MGDCLYCKKNVFFEGLIHKECKIDHYESSFKRLDSGVGLTATHLGENLFLKEITDTHVEILESNFMKPQGEKWLWMQPEFTVHFPYAAEMWEKSLLGISDGAIYIRVLGHYEQRPMRWPLSKVGQVSAQKSAPLEWISSKYGNECWNGFRVEMAENVQSFPDCFVVSLTWDEDFGSIHAAWFKRLVAGALTSQTSVQAPAQPPVPAQATTPQQTSSPTKGKSIVEELRELAELKTLGILTEEEFNKAKAKIL